MSRYIYIREKGLIRTLNGEIYIYMERTRKRDIERDRGGCERGSVWSALSSRGFGIYSRLPARVF